MTELEQELYNHLWEVLLTSEYIANKFGTVDYGPSRKGLPDLDKIAAKFRDIGWTGWSDVLNKAASDWNNVPLNKALS